MSGADERDTRQGAVSGHRAAAHTADVRVEAWAPTRELCIAEAVLGAVATFVEITPAQAEHVVRRRVVGGTDEDILVAVLDEVIYLLDTAGEVPVHLEVEPADGGVETRLAMVDLAGLTQIGAVPKGVSWHELRFGPDQDRWSCAVTLDV